MTPKQKLFADEYLIDLNATRAYKAVYKNVKSDEVAAVNASRLLSNANISAMLNERMNKMSSEKIADAKEVMEYLTSVLRGELSEEVVVVEGEGDGCSSARKIKKEVSPKDRNKAAELLGKRYSLYTDKQQVTHTIQPQESWFEDEN